MLCNYSLLGLIDQGELPEQREFKAHCTCGAYVLVTDGQIPAHAVGEDQLGVLA